MLQINNVCVEYNQKILFENLTLHIHAGEMFCITGESGSGKTSLLRSILGFVPLKAGEIRINNILLSAQTIGIIRQEIAYIPQELSFPLEWVKDMVELPFGLKSNCAKLYNQEELYEYFSLLGLEKELLNKRINEISGGQKQRIIIATCALLKKSLFIIDEPTSALDIESAQKVFVFLQYLSQKGQTIIVVSHDKTFVAGCNRTLFL